MSKKGLFASLIISCVLTLSLGIYTLVSVFGGTSQEPQKPTNTTVNVAFRTEDIVSELSGYSLDDIEFKLAEGAQNPLQLNEETGEYKAVSAGEVSAIITVDKKGNTKTFVIKVYAQGDGSEENPHIIANAGHLLELQKIVNTTSAEKVIPANIKLVSDIDIGEYNWKPIGGQGNNEYTGTFDGNGHTINNLTISVNQSNFEEFLAVSNTTENRAFLDLGLFGKVGNAKILNLNVENATINVSSEIYTLIAEQTKPEGAAYDKVVRLTIGTIAGSAYNTDIIGSEGKSKIVSRINAFSCGNSSQAHGVGGVVGVAQLVRISNYSVKTNIINNLELTKGSNIGGVFGSSYSSYNAGYTNTYDASHKTVIDNVEVDFASTLLYKNDSLVGGVVGLANNTGIINTNVNSFKVVDNTARKFVDYSVEKVTMAAGVAGEIRSLPVSGEAASYQEVVDAFVSNVENVSVNNIDVFMLGGDVAGAIAIAGKTYTELSGLTETMVVKDTTVSGNMIANSVGGFVWQVNPGVTITYTKTFDKPVVDVDLQAHMSAGFAFINEGKVSGYETEVEVPATEEGADATTKTVRTQIKVNTTGMGGLIENPTTENIYLARTATYAAGVVGKSMSNENLLEEFPAIVENFDVKFTATGTINYGGIAYKTENTGLRNISVNADFTSYNYDKLGNNISTTYMVSGGVCEAGSGTAIYNVDVVINANKNITDKTLKYGATFFGGLVARYTGDNDLGGLAILASEVSGDVYFNHSYEDVVMGGKTYNVFIAGGLIGAIEAKDGSNEYVDALGIASIEFTYNCIVSNSVSNLKITADFKDEVMGNQGYRTKGIGALVGVLNVGSEDTDPVLDLSSNTVTNVEIVADDETFTYAYSLDGGSTVENITLGANKLNSYGASYSWNLGDLDKVTNPEEIGVTYSSLAEEE